MSPDTAPYRKPGARPIWCPGCGLHGLYTCLLRAYAQLGLDRDRLVLVSGIGCSSRLPFFVDCYGFHSVHGRALPAALGIKVANPELTVVVVSGDGDGLSIGGNHFIHAARRNPDLTCILANNAIYGMTKGQLSPTSPYGMKTASTPLGSFDYPLDPAAMAIISGATSVSRGFPARADELTELFVAGLTHPGFSFIEVLTPCVTFNKAMGYQSIAQAAAAIPAGHAPDDMIAALRLALDLGTNYFGTLYRTIKPTYHRRMEEMYGRMCPVGEEDFLHLLSRLGS